jgi:hypothetical protein
MSQFRTDWEPPEDEDYIRTRPPIRRETEQQAKARRQASIFLFLIAGLQIVCGMGALLVLQNAGQQQAVIPKEALHTAMIMVGAMAVVYTGLGVLSLFHPLPAVIAGLVIYVVMLGLDFIAAPGMVSKGLWIRLGIVAGLIQTLVVLVKARTEAQYRSYFKDRPEDRFRDE